MNDKLFKFALVAMLGCSAALVSTVVVTNSRSADVIVTAEVEETGLFFNREGRSPRTQPVDPAAPAVPSVAAPIFEAPPASGVAPAAISPEQKEQLKGIVVQLVTLLAGAFLGSGSASPFLKLILEKLLGAVGGATPVPGTPVRTSRRKKVVAKP